MTLEEIGIILDEQDGSYVAVIERGCGQAIYGVGLSAKSAVRRLLERLVHLSARGLRYYDYFGHHDALHQPSLAPHEWLDVTTHNDQVARFECANCDGRKTEPRTEFELTEEEDNMAKFQIGDKVRDRVTGVEGTITGAYQYVSGPDRFGLEYVDKAGRAAEHTVDEQRLVLLETAGARDQAADDMPMREPRELRTSEPIEQAAEAAGDSDAD